MRSWMWLPLLAACGGKGGSDSAPGTGPAPVLPVDGAWVVTFDGDALSDSCDPVSSRYVPQPVSLQRGGPSTFDWTEWGQTVSCAVSGATFTCDPMTNTWSPEAGVTLSDSIVASGEIVSETALDFDYDIEMDCEGAPCGNYGAYQGVGWPCSLVQRATADPS